MYLINFQIVQVLIIATLVIYISGYFSLGIILVVIIGECFWMCSDVNVQYSM